LIKALSEKYILALWYNLKARGRCIQKCSHKISRHQV